MKIIAVFLLAGLGIHVFAVQSRMVQPTVAAPIPTTYSISNNKSLILSELPQQDKFIQLINATNGRIACTIGAPSSKVAPEVPVSPAIGKEVYLLLSEPFVVNGPGKNVYCRCISGTCFTGELFLQTF